MLDQENDDEGFQSVDGPLLPLSVPQKPQPSKILQRPRLNTRYSAKVNDFWQAVNHLEYPFYCRYLHNEAIMQKEGYEDNLTIRQQMNTALHEEFEEFLALRKKKSAGIKLFKIELTDAVFPLFEMNSVCDGIKYDRIFPISRNPYHQLVQFEFAVQSPSPLWLALNEFTPSGSQESYLESLLISYCNLANESQIKAVALKYFQRPQFEIATKQQRPTWPWPYRSPEPISELDDPKLYNDWRSGKVTWSEKVGWFVPVPNKKQHTDRFFQAEETEQKRTIMIPLAEIKKYLQQVPTSETLTRGKLLKKIDSFLVNTGIDQAPLKYMPSPFTTIPDDDFADIKFTRR